MRMIRAVSSARARKLRKLGERVWWDRQWEVLVWDMAASRRKRPYCPKMPAQIAKRARNDALALGITAEQVRDRFVISSRDGAPCR